MEQKLEIDFTDDEIERIRVFQDLLIDKHLDRAKAFKYVNEGYRVPTGALICKWASGNCRANA